jgi:hypothetical protein
MKLGFQKRPLIFKQISGWIDESQKKVNVDNASASVSTLPLVQDEARGIRWISLKRDLCTKG